MIGGHVISLVVLAVALFLLDGVAECASAGLRANQRMTKTEIIYLCGGVAIGIWLAIVIHELARLFA